MGTELTESAMDGAGIGFSFISEKPENVDALRAPGLLVLSVYYDPSPEMTDAIERYLQRGGSVHCLDGLSSVSYTHLTLPTILLV